MEDKELFETWKIKDDQEENVYDKHKEDYVTLVKRQSNDVFQKIRKNVIIELIITVLLGFSIFYVMIYFKKDSFNSFYFSISVIFLFIITSLSICFYVKYLRSIKSVNEINLKDSIEKKINILSNYIRQLKFLLYILFPIGYALGVFVGVNGKEMSNIKILLLCGVSIPIITASFWSGKKYIHALYGKHLGNIREIYQNLLNEN